MPLIVSLLALLALGSAASAQDPIKQGRAILKEFCAECHAIDKTGDSPQPLALPFRRLGHSFDLDQFARQLERGILAGHPSMPDFKFSAEDARAAAVYLRSIQE